MLTTVQAFTQVQTDSTPQGRFLAFPNVSEHRVSPFRLADPAKPGHRRYNALWLVDPRRRIISTANVPPQQQDWWTESIFGESEDSQASAASQVPQYIVQLLREKGSHCQTTAPEPDSQLSCWLW